MNIITPSEIRRYQLNARPLRPAPTAAASRFTSYYFSAEAAGDISAHRLGHFGDVSAEAGCWPRKCSRGQQASLHAQYAELASRRMKARPRRRGGAWADCPRHT